MQRFTELRAHSAFSFLRAGSLPEDLIEQAAKLGYSALALGDRDGLYGAPRFHQAAKKAGMKAIIGAELTLRPPPNPLLGKEGELVSSLAPISDLPSLDCSLYLLAATRQGYQNLCKVITQTKLRSPKGESFATWEDLEGHTDGLICLAGGMEGPLAQVVTRLGGYAVTGDAKEAFLTANRLPEPPLTASRLTANRLNLLDRLRLLFPSRLYIDLQRHLDPGEERLNRVLLDVARHCRIPIV
ncbi:MAG: PHP domain-containing protein, partial [Deltaproteobacteria bacterium]|nr:PHP domain-containing protein [Deltaproteobacteria bacterium]